MLASTAHAQQAPQQPLADVMAEFAAANARQDEPGTGAFPAIKLVELTLPKHVVYRPADLGALRDQKLGIFVWGNGGCSDDGASARFHLAEIASHAFIAIAPGAVRSGPDAPGIERAAPSGPPQLKAETSADDVRAGIDWTLAENARPGSPYYQRIDPEQIAVGGHSCGGLQSVMAGADPRVATVMVHNSGMFNDGTQPIAGLTVDKSMLSKLHTSVLYVLGGPSDIAYPNGMDDFDRINHVPVMLLDANVGHGGTFHKPNGGMVGKISVDWLQWQLRGDQNAAKTFTGPDCLVCKDPQWTVKRKKFD